MQLKKERRGCFYRGWQSKISHGRKAETVQVHSTQDAEGLRASRYYHG